MIAMSKPPHKFFSAFLNNDVISLSKYLVDVQDKMLDGTICNIPLEVRKLYTRMTGPATQFGPYYNIFSDNFKIVTDEIRSVQASLKELTKEASEYYGIDYDKQNYQINGWFNVDYGTVSGNRPSPLDNPERFHDHMEGEGAPVFHGYYCVTAEPSSTYYLIDGDKENLFENINKNNRLILSETGHPHGIGNWDWEGARVTIAYDIVPESLGFGPHWIPL